MTALWKEYVKERESGDAIEVEGGILFFAEEGEDFLHILEFFVQKQFRHRRKFFDLINKLKEITIARKKKFITGYVQLSANNCEDVLKSALYYGFKILELDKKKITIYLEV